MEGLLVNKTTLANSVAQQIKKMVIDKKLKPGDRLPPQRVLAEQLGVGRPTIREALHRLEEMGLVKIRHGSGTTIESANVESITVNIAPLLAITETDVLSLLEAKRIIETKSSELAAERAEEEDIQEMHKWIREMENSRNDSERYSEADYSFHLTIVRSARNPVISEIMKIVGRMFYGAIARTAGLPGREIAMRYHKRILAAIEERNPDKTSKLVQEHILETMGRVRKASKYFEAGA
jgi:GntR family transcriptional repressor for pyruvate dehydrogenase complex